MDMKLKIIYKNRETVELQLTQNEQVLDMLIMPLDPAVGNKRSSTGEKLIPNGGVDFSFDTVLVTSIDKLLKRNRIARVSLSDIVIKGFENESSMSSLIAKTVAEALKIK
ncbi:MAG: hypothetical protein UU70_C0025G0003 [Candidatus Yanofskybacteria bacterium GW2011_GWA1_41_6]|uniref:Uncharacterized protein n=1 Tax=Candidatus Yanofskybacteria bacterium GW2011_GWA1_41_6 TaxID=1619020 RepID=A0A0G0WJH7_9BACT|nr:MAG: hypothetical protein UU70_C0025G0003 [Candidatus Yanofskybacteria bacterium GW2011_GWA1_41_6]